MKTVIKILTALATVAGIVYIVATYGEQIVNWCKKVLESMPKCPKCEDDGEIEVEIVVEKEAEEAPAAEEAAEEVPAEEAVAEEPAAEEPAAEEPAAEEPVADEADFAE